MVDYLYRAGAGDLTAVAHSPASTSEPLEEYTAAKNYPQPVSAFDLAIPLQDTFSGFYPSDLSSMSSGSVPSRHGKQSPPQVHQQGHHSLPPHRQSLRSESFESPSSRILASHHSTPMSSFRGGDSHSLHNMPGSSLSNDDWRLHASHMGMRYITSRQGSPFSQSQQSGSSHEWTHLHQPNVTQQKFDTSPALSAAGQDVYDNIGSELLNADLATSYVGGFIEESNTAPTQQLNAPLPMNLPDFAFPAPAQPRESATRSLFMPLQSNENFHPQYTASDTVAPSQSMLSGFYADTQLNAMNSSNPYSTSNNQYSFLQTADTPQFESAPFASGSRDHSRSPGPDRGSTSESATRPRRPGSLNIDIGEPTLNKTGEMVCTFKGCEMGHPSFTRRSEWAKHMDRHIRPYHCVDADCISKGIAGFTYAGGLKRHEKEVHGKHGGPTVQLICPWDTCKRKAGGSTFSRKTNFDQHLKRVHGGKLPDDSHMRYPDDRAYYQDANGWMR